MQTEPASKSDRSQRPSEGRSPRQACAWRLSRETLRRGRQNVLLNRTAWYRAWRHKLLHDAALLSDLLFFMQLDGVDLRILTELQRDGALSNVELARRVHLSPSPCLARVKALQAAGVIARYVALLDAGAIGLGLNVFISISLKAQNKASLAEFEQRIAEHDEVMECYLMTGDSDYLVRVVVADIGALEKFILEQLTPIAGIEKIRSSFALKQVRYKTALPLPPPSPPRSN